MAKYDPMRERLATYPDEFKDCRERRHHWKKRGKYRTREGSRVYIVVIFDCVGGCEGDAWVYFNAKGEFVKRIPHYKKGYLFKLTAEEREANFRFTGRKVTEYEIKNKIGVEPLPEEWT